MPFVFSIKDTYRAAVEAATGGKNTVLYDDKGNPSIMVVIPKFNIADVITGGAATPHPAFIVNGVVKDAIYVSKYQNVVSDSRAYSLPMQDPANSLSFDSAKTNCQNKGQGWHLMTNAEWAAIALWCKKNNFMPRGNNNYGSDVAASHEVGKMTYMSSPTQIGRVATGSGPAAWAHDNTNEGIFDLNGNVSEWVGGMRLNAGEIQIIKDNDAAIYNADQTVNSALWKALLADGSLVAPGTADTLKWDYVASKIQLCKTITVQADASRSNTFETTTAEGTVTPPEILKALALHPVDSSHGGDYLYMNNGAGLERLPRRGGFWNNGANAGVFNLHLSYPRSIVDTLLGFRSAFVL